MSLFTTSVRNVLRRHFVTPFGKTADHLVIYMSTIEVVEISNTIFKIFGDSSFLWKLFYDCRKTLPYQYENQIFREVLQVIDRDLCLGVFDAANTNHHIAVSRQIPSENKTSCSSIASFKVETQPFMPWEESYWKEYGIDLATLKRYNVRSIISCTFTKASGGEFAVYGSKAIPTYGYFFDGSSRVKNLSAKG